MTQIKLPYLDHGQQMHIKNQEVYVRHCGKVLATGNVFYKLNAGIFKTLE